MEIKFNKIKYKDIIKNFNVNLSENEIVTITGKNRSGKTTILDLIYGLKLPDEGEVEINNVSQNKSNKKLLRKNISYLTSEFYTQLFNINILEDIKYISKVKDMEKINELLELFNLDKTILSKNYTELSKGELAKILLVIIILKNSNIILLDNPTLYLDNKSINTLVKILRKIKRNNKIILISSMNSEFILQVTDRVIAIDNGEIIMDDTKYNVLSNDIILDKINLAEPNIIAIEKLVKNKKNIKLGYRDNINDLIKDIYRNV